MLTLYMYVTVKKCRSIYNSIWDAAMGEELQCCRNPRDPSAVAVTRESVTVGHVPRKICSVFLR